MNIFMTSECPIESAYEHCRVHRNKMCTELSQILCTAHRILDGDTYADANGFYKATHKNHPSCIFVRSCPEAYEWAYLHLMTLHQYYEEDRDKEHASKRLLDALATVPTNIGDKPFKPVIAAPEPFKVYALKVGVPKAYQEYLKEKFAEWQSRERPIKTDWPFGVPKWMEK